jgi:hypothetical protein
VTVTQINARTLDARRSAERVVAREEQTVRDLLALVAEYRRAGKTEQADAWQGAAEALDRSAKAGAESLLDWSGGNCDCEGRKFAPRQHGARR